MLQAKQKRKMQRASLHSEEVRARAHDLSSGGLESSTVNIVVDNEQALPTEETKVSPIPASVDHAGD